MKKLFFFAAMSSVLFCSCNKDQKSDIVPDKGVLTFSNVMVADMETRAPEAGPAAFKIYLPVDAGGFYKTAEDRDVTKSGDAYTYTEPIYLNKARELYAWAPSTITGVTTNTAVTYAMASTVAMTANDLVYQSQSVDAASANVTVALNYAYAKITFTLVQENYSGAGQVSSLALSDIPSTATLSLKDGTLSDVVSTPGTLELVSAPQAFTAPISALVVPAAPGADLTVKCTLDGDVYTVSLKNNIATFAAGTEYKVTLKIKGATFSIDGVSINGRASVDGGEHELTK